MKILVSGIVLSIGIQIILCTGKVGGEMYSHCYFKSSVCDIKNITCYNNTVINIGWSRVGYSKYWELDNSHTNCSVTDENCEKEIDEPSRNCSGLTVCSLYTCSSSSHQAISCNGSKSANYMRINYTCKKEREREREIFPIITVNTTSTADTSRQSTSDDGNKMRAEMPRNSKSNGESQSNVAVTTSTFLNTQYTTDTNKQWTSNNKSQSNVAVTRSTFRFQMTTETTKNSKSFGGKPTIIVISVMTVIIIIVVIVVVVVVIVIRRRRKKKGQSHSGDDPKEANNSPVLRKQESSVNVIDNANDVTSGKMIEDTLDLETRCVDDPSLETTVVDNVNYASFGQREDPDQIDLPTSKTDLNTDTELVDNDDYVGFGEK